MVTQAEFERIVAKRLRQRNGMQAALRSVATERNRLRKEVEEGKQAIGLLNDAYSMVSLLFHRHGVAIRTLNYEGLLDEMEKFLREAEPLLRPYWHGTR